MQALIAAAESATTTDITNWGQLTAQGVIATLFAFLLMKGLPNIISEFRQEAATGRKWHEDRVNEMDKAMERREQIFEKTVDKFNDTTIRLLTDRKSGQGQ